MGFSRRLSDNNIRQIQAGDTSHVLTDDDFKSRVGRHIKFDTTHNAALFALLKNDVMSGKVFPAIRDNELHFYYKGGCLFKFAKGTFLRDSKYELYGYGCEMLPVYDRFKKQNENKNTNKRGQITERQLLDNLYCHTYNRLQRIYGF